MEPGFAARESGFFLICVVQHMIQKRFRKNKGYFYTN